MFAKRELFSFVIIGLHVCAVVFSVQVVQSSPVCLVEVVCISSGPLDLEMYAGSYRQSIYESESTNIKGSALKMPKHMHKENKNCYTGKDGFDLDKQQPVLHYPSGLVALFVSCLCFL